MAGAHPDATAWVNLADGSELTFGEWDAQSNRLARGLGRRGLAAGDRVVIAIGPDEPFPWLIAYAAVHRAGGVAVPVNTRLAGPELVAILDHAEPSVVLASPTTEGGVPWTDLVDGVPGLRLLATAAPGEAVLGLLDPVRPRPDGARPIRDRSTARPLRPKGRRTSCTPRAPPESPRRWWSGTIPISGPGGRSRWNGLGFMTASPFSTTSGHCSSTGR